MPWMFIVVLMLAVPAFADQPSVSITTDDMYRYIHANGIPDHDHGQFPNAHNPNTISEQNYNFRVPLRPQSAGALTRVHGRQLLGVALNGVPFDPGTAEVWNNDPSSGWNYDALSGAINLGIDQNNAHVQPSGAYHYHGIPKALVKGPMTLIGYAADGYPIYAETGLHSSYRLKEGTRPSGPGGSYDGTFVQDFEYKQGAGELDECNGAEGKTPEHPQGTYFYALTDRYPFVPRCLKGEPDPSFTKKEEHRAGVQGRGPQGMGGQDNRGPQGMSGGRDEEPGAGPGQRGPGRGGPQGGHRTPPPEAKSACQGQSEGASCGFETPRGRLDGVCRQVPEGLLCVPRR